VYSRYTVVRAEEFQLITSFCDQDAALEIQYIVYAYVDWNLPNLEAPLKRIPVQLAGVAIAIALSAMSGFAQLAEKKSLTLATAKQIAAAAEAEATNNKFAMVITILDDGGNLMYLQRMDDAQLASIQISQGKAHTALAFKRPTKMLEDGVAAGRTATLSLPGAVLIEGGLPLTADGKVIGSIGVSGGTSAQDGMVAKAGVDALAKLLAH
jgi:glc operon protein GlcG